MPDQDPFLPALGAVIAARRARLKLSQQALADRVGTTQKRIWDLESGRRGDIHVVKTLAPLAAALGMSRTELLAAIEVEMRDQAAEAAQA